MNSALRQRKIEEEAKKANLPIGILRAVGGFPPEEEETVKLPTLVLQSPPGGSPLPSPPSSPEPVSFCVAVPAAMLLVGGMVMLMG